MAKEALEAGFEVIVFEQTNKVSNEKTHFFFFLLICAFLKDWWKLGVYYIGKSCLCLSQHLYKYVSTVNVLLGFSHAR